MAKSAQQQFLDKTVKSLLEPEEKVLLRGTFENPARWAIAAFTAIFTLGLTILLRRFYYLVVTDRRVLYLRAQRKIWFRLGIPLSFLSAGTKILEQTAMPHPEIARIAVNKQAIVHMLLGWRGLAIEDKSGNKMPMFVKRGGNGLGDEQKKTYHELADTVSKQSGAKVKYVGKRGK